MQDRFALIALFAVSFCAANGHAQQVADNGRIIYEAVFFAPYSPVNALQIVERVPGFTFDEGDTEVRGFSQAAGNVVINGRRPSSKSETLDTVLARIPASRILRVELASGDQFGSDYAGKPQVVNIVLSEGGGIAGTAEVTLNREYFGRILPDASVSALIQRGPSTFNVAASLRQNITTENGTDRIVDLPSGEQRELRIKVNRRQEPVWRGSASWALEEGDNRSAHLNASLSTGAFLLHQTNHVIPRGAAERADTLYNRYLGRTIEVGGDIMRPLAGGGIKLLGLITRRYRNRDDISAQNTLAGSGLGGVEQNLMDWKEESVGRLTWSKPKLAGWSVELGGEGALNRLTSGLNLAQINAAGVRTPVDLPLDNAVVTEYRGEAFANIGRDLRPGLRLDMGLTYEASKLTVTGDTQARRSLRFLKPKATVDWRRGAWHGQLSVQRTVAQLNFENFISAADIGSERINGGNAALVPQRAWEMLASVDRAILGDGRIKIDLGYNVVEKVQDRVKVRDAQPATPTSPAVPALDAPGNLGDGSELIARANIDLPLVRMGIKGGRLSLYGSYVRSSVLDPYTLRRRPFSGAELFNFSANFRQDLGKFAWGLEVEGDTPWTGYRLEETDKFVEAVPTVELFAEYRPTRAWTFIVGARNLTDMGIVRRRNFYRPDRTNPEPYAREERVRNSHVLGYLTVKRSFG